MFAVHGEFLARSVSFISLSHSDPVYSLIHFSKTPFLKRAITSQLKCKNPKTTHTPSLSSEGGSDVDTHFLVKNVGTRCSATGQEEISTLDRKRYGHLTRRLAAS